MFQTRCICLLVIFLMLFSVNHQNKSITTTSPIVFSHAGQNQSPKNRTNPIDGAEMVYIPPGAFIMGSNTVEIDHLWRKFEWPQEWKQHTKSEQPAHQVEVDEFWMYRNNVIVAQYLKFCKATKRSMPPPPMWEWTDSYPIVNVSWEDAKAYCTWAGSRLPYEAEWEYAARGGNTGLGTQPRTIFVWGDDYPKSKVANLADSSFKKSKYYNPDFYLFSNYDDGYTHTSPVGIFPPNRFGLHDMAGNVLQWCEDWFDKDYYKHSPANNPRGASHGELRVLRGGAFDTIPAITRISRRLGNSPGVHHDDKGFRCVQKH